MYGRLFSTIQVVRNTEKKIKLNCKRVVQETPLKSGDLVTAGCGEVNIFKWPNCPPTITKTIIRCYSNQKYQIE